MPTFGSSNIITGYCIDMDSPFLLCHNSGQSADADAGADFVALVDADEHTGPGLQLPRQAQASRDDPAAPGDCGSEFGDDRVGVFVVAADKNILMLQRAFVFPEVEGRNMVEGTDDSGTGNELLGLLGRAASPHADRVGALGIEAERVDTTDHDFGVEFGCQ